MTVHSSEAVELSTETQTGMKDESNHHSDGSSQNTKHHKEAVEVVAKSMMLLSTLVFRGLVQGSYILAETQPMTTTI